MCDADVSPRRYDRRMARAFQLRITLEGIRPAIWRRVAVPGNLNLARLHGVIQDAMGWEDCHLHEFEAGDTRFGPACDLMFGARVEDEKRYTLERLFATGDRFRYVYDMGDSWMHEIVVERVTEVAGTFPPRCLAGARACPPEDCGGPWGYADLVEAMSPSNERHEEVSEWLGETWSPEVFDVEAADRLIARHQPQSGRPRGSRRAGARARPRA
jgi:hypothetical protein